MLSLLQSLFRNLEWLPTLAVVAALLYVAYRWTEEGRTVFLGDSEQGELRIEVDKFLDDYFLHVATTFFHCLLVSLLQFIIVVNIALTMAA